MECGCEKCKALCKGNPGWFNPEQVEKAAGHLQLSTEEFFQEYLIVEYWEGLGPPTYVLAPRRTWQRPGMASFADNLKDGNCALLGEEGCLLPHDLRPVECSTALGCSPGNATKRDVIKDGWKEFQQLVDKLLDEVE